MNTSTQANNTSTTTKGITMNTNSNNNQGTNMNPTTFEQAVYNRINSCKTWNATRLNTVVRDMWSKDKTLVKGETTGDFIAKFFANFRGDLQARRFNFFDSHLVVEIYNRTWNEHINATPKEDYIKDVIEAPVVIQKPIYEVNVYTDGSCNVGAGTGGWGTFFTIEGHTKFNKELSGCAVKTTNNAMELTAVLEALKAMNLTKEGFVFNIITDSKYVLQSLSNKNRYISQGFKKAANIEILKEIFSVMDAKGIKLESCPTKITGNKSIQSGEVVLKTVDGKINFLWVKGHSSNGGNDKADKLATDARKQLDKDLKHSVDVVVPEMALEASNVSVVDSTVDQKMVTKDMIENAKTFDDIKHIISLSEDLKLGGTCGEDFTYYTKVLHKGKSVFEIVSPERVSSREGYIKSAARQLVQYLKAEGIYSDSNSSVDSVPSVEVTPSDLEAVAEYNKLNSTHDFTYMMSDDSRAYKSGLKSEKALAAIESTISPLQLDLVALYHNHILGRAGQFGKSTTLLEDSVENATKYFS